MSETIDSLVLDLLEWIGPNARPYSDVLEAWRTSCPRLPVWEEANDRGFVASYHEAGRGRLVSVTPAGWEQLENADRRHVIELRSPATAETARNV
jgi:hypothetical protein